MDDDTLFRLLNAAVMPAWLLLTFTPRWRLATDWIAPLLVPMLMACAYGLLMINGPTIEGGGFDSLDGVSKLFSHRSVVLVGWIHYLAFDLFVGAWEVRDAQAHEIPHLWVVPCLWLTLFAGPLGFAAYVVVRSIQLRRFTLTPVLPRLPNA